MVYEVFLSYFFVASMSFVTGAMVTGIGCLIIFGIEKKEK